MAQWPSLLVCVTSMTGAGGCSLRPTHGSACVCLRVSPCVSICVSVYMFLWIGGCGSHHSDAQGTETKAEQEKASDHSIAHGSATYIPYIDRAYSTSRSIVLLCDVLVVVLAAVQMGTNSGLHRQGRGYGGVSDLRWYWYWSECWWWSHRRDGDPDDPWETSRRHTTCSCCVPRRRGQVLEDDMGVTS